MDYTNHTPFWKDNVQGTRDDDRIFTGWDDDVVNGSGGDDFIDGGQGRDQLSGGDDDDTIFGDNNEDFLSGGEGNDRLDGGLHADEIRGDGGNDTLIGGGGSDSMFGGANNDTFLQLGGSYDADFIDGGIGIDTVDYVTLSSAAPYTGEVRVSVVLSDNGNGTATHEAMQYQGTWPFGPSEAIGFGPPTTDTLRSIENVRTGQEDDSLTGNASANRLDSGAGNDVLTGRGGADVLISGGGNDTYVYERVSDSPTASGNFSTADIIVGFGDRAGNQDRIDLSAIDANTLFRVGNQAFTFDDGDGVREIGELHVFQIVDPNQNDRIVTVVAADTNGLGGYDFAIRFDQVIATLDRGDFIL